MSTALDSLSHKVQRAAVGTMVDVALAHVNKDRQKAIAEMVDVAKQFYGDSFSEETYEHARAVLADPDSKWSKLINCVLSQTDPNVARTTAMRHSSGAPRPSGRTGSSTAATSRGSSSSTPLRPAICTVWAAGRASTAIRTTSALRIWTRSSPKARRWASTSICSPAAGEPLVRKADILRLAEKHNDVQFAIYTNSTLIDEPFCEQVVKLGNIAFMLSIEGTPSTNDARRGEGHYAAVMHAMDLLKAHGILFGTSICYTRDNLEAVTSDHFMRMLCDKGAHFGFYFHYMPVGNEAAPELMPTPAQRKYMLERIRYLRSEKSDIPFYPMDFQNDGEFVGGCIAGGRNYFHINSAGDAEPCVFIHYSNANIHDSSILDILRSPLFMAYHNGQPFNKNHLRPCPMLENPELLRKMVHDTGAHSTDLQSPETVDHLCDKCAAYAADWQPVADEIWSHVTLRESRYENYKDWRPTTAK